MLHPIKIIVEFLWDGQMVREIVDGYLVNNDEEYAIAVHEHLILIYRVEKTEQPGFFKAKDTLFQLGEVEKRGDDVTTIEKITKILVGINAWEFLTRYIPWNHDMDFRLQDAIKK